MSFILNQIRQQMNILLHGSEETEKERYRRTKSGVKSQLKKLKTALKKHPVEFRAAFEGKLSEFKMRFKKALIPVNGEEGITDEQFKKARDMLEDLYRDVAFYVGRLQ